MWPAPPVGSTTVRLSATAVTPSGIPPLPAIFTRVSAQGCTRPAGAPVPSRVSSSRVGPYGVNLVPAVATVTLLVVVSPLPSETVTVTVYWPRAA